MHTVEDNILLALKSDRAAASPPCSGATAPEPTAASTAFSQTIRPAGVRHRVAGGLSHGQKQWLEIGMLLAQEPKLLLVDEPVAGMTDAETAADRRTAQARSTATAPWSWSSTTWPSCASSASRSPCLHEGSVLAEGTIDQVSANERVIEVYLGR